METLTPIDEAAEDLDDQPITMVPKIVKTAPSPVAETAPMLEEREPLKKEINQIESVL